MSLLETMVHHQVNPVHIRSVCPLLTVGDGNRIRIFNGIDCLLRKRNGQSGIGKRDIG